jgi:hypothetical protein
MPGCMARVQDPEAECTCSTLAARLRRAEATVSELREREAYASTWWQALTDAVHAHPAAAEVLADARRRAGR